MSAPRVSVVVPARDAAATLGGQLAALARQDVDFGWEVLVCDNGSSDGTLAVARGWKDALPGLRIIDASGRRGAAAARNAGAAAAAGGLLLFCDADDEVADGWLAAMAEALADAEAVAGARRYDRLNAEPFGPDDWTDPLFTVPYAPGLPAASSNNLGVRRAVFDELGGFDETLRTGEDVDLCWRVQLAGYRLAGEPRAVVDVRRRTGLVAVLRQFYGYGLGDAALMRKHPGLVGRSTTVPAGRPGPPLPDEPTARSSGPVVEPPPPVVASRGSRARRALDRMAHGRAPVDLTFAAARTGRRLGRTRGRLA